MIELSQLTVLVIFEVIVGLVILSGALLYFTLMRKGRVRKAAHHLAQRVQSDKPARTQRLKGLLSGAYGLSGNELEQILHKITQAEMKLFQNLINGYIKDDQALLRQVDVDEESLVQAYQELKPSAGGKAAEAGEGEEDTEEEMQRLRDENQRLSDELRVTMDTMGRMLNEYSSMFAGGIDKPLTRPLTAEASDAATATTGEAVEQAVETEVEIPDLQASDLAVEPMPDAAETLRINEEEEEGALDDEVSEIIDEVMGIADEMQQDGEGEQVPEVPPADSGESLMDEVEQVDIELPEKRGLEEAEAVASEPETETEPEPGSLEEEWAKLLEEDAAGKGKSDDKET